MDVTIRDPLLPPGPLGAAAAYPGLQRRLEQAKVTKYTRQCASLGWEFIPFLCDVFGNLGPEAHQFMARLAKVKHDNAPHQDRCTAKATVWQQLSFATMKEIGRQLSWAVFLPSRGEGEG